MAATAAIVAAAVASFAPWELTVLSAWVAAAFAYLTSAWRVILGSDGEETRRLATIEDDSRPVSDALVVAASTSSLIGAALALHKATAVSGITSAALTIGAVTTVVVSWLVVNTDFTLRYAHLYYSSSPGGVTFAGVERPDFRDFAYLAFTVGMTYQVSDTGLLGPRFRRILLAHALVSYGFGVVIIAATINIVASIVR